MADEPNEFAELENLIEAQTARAPAANQQKPKQTKAKAIAPEIADTDDSERKLSEALALIEKLRAENEALVAMEAGRRVSSSDTAYVGEHGGYMFEVGPKNPDKFPGLPTVLVTAVDESEAKRFYSNSRDWPVGSGMSIDTMQVPLVVTIKDNRRNAVIILQKRLSVIRNKLERGQGLSDQEQELLLKYEAEIHQF